MLSDIVAFANNGNVCISELEQFKLGLKRNENYIILGTFQVRHRNSFENEPSNIIIFAL